MKITVEDLDILLFFKENENVTFHKFIRHLIENNLRYKHEYFYYYLGLKRSNNFIEFLEYNEEYPPTCDLNSFWNTDSIAETELECLKMFENYPESKNLKMKDKIVNSLIWKQWEKCIEIVEELEHDKHFQEYDNYSGIAVSDERDSFCEACQTYPCMCSDPIGKL